jgi:dTDP-4-dehydrorhamnose reductase
VADQIGCPTSARDIAAALRSIALRASDGAADTPWGTYHFVNAGEASWYELARHVFGFERLRRREIAVNPIESAAYPTRAKRPRNSRLDTTQIRENFGFAPRPWQKAIDEILAELTENKRTEVRVQ